MDRLFPLIVDLGGVVLVCLSCCWSAGVCGWRRRRLLRRSFRVQGLVGAGRLTCGGFLGDGFKVLELAVISVSFPRALSPVFADFEEEGVTRFYLVTEIPDWGLDVMFCLEPVNVVY